MLDPGTTCRLLGGRVARPGLVLVIGRIWLEQSEVDSWVVIEPVVVGFLVPE